MEVDTTMTGPIRNMRWAVALTVVLLAISGCLHAGGTQAEEIRTDSVEAMESVDTYAFDAETDIEAKAGEREIEDSLSITYFARGTASESAGRMKTSSNFVVNEETVDQETYSEEGTAYVRLRNDEEENTEKWYKMDSDTTTPTPVGGHIRLLETSEAEYEREETVDGEPAHLLSLNTDTEEFEGFVVGSSRGLMYRIGMFDRGMFDNTDVEDASLRYWISDETDRVIRVETTANVTTSLRDAEENLKMTIGSQTEFSSYGGEVETEAPEGIENAEELGDEVLFGGFSASSSERVSEQRAREGAGSSSGVVDALEVEARENEKDTTHTAKVITNPVGADTITAEASESGDDVSTDTPETSDVLELGIDPDGDEVAVTVTRGNETEVVYTREVP